jgi:colicin import membrane protein
MPPSRDNGRWSRGKWIAAVLAVVINLGFVAFLFFSATWQNRKPEAVSVELYAPPGPSAQAAKATPAPPVPVPEPPTPPPEPPKAEPEPPKPQPEPPKPQPEVPKPAPEPPKPPPQPPPPKIEPPGPSKADIALKDKQEKERLKAAQAEAARQDALKKEAAKREADKRDADRKKLEEKRLAEVRERQVRETAALNAQADRERQIAVAAARATQAKANADYVGKIQAKVRGNVVLPPDIPGNPEAVFDVVQLPTGEILDAHLRKSSGIRAYDDAVQRAIIKSSPLPRPDSPDLFQRELTLKFRPQD